jgi:hypothetical protein
MPMHCYSLSQDLRKAERLFVQAARAVPCTFPASGGILRRLRQHLNLPPKVAENLALFKEGQNLLQRKETQSSVHESTKN